jgi:diguanylate cyclase (GGDEF)-like protein
MQQMTHSLLNGVAATTTHRDRDELDRALARLLLQFLDTGRVTLLRLVSDVQVKRIEHRVCMDRGGNERDLVAMGDPTKLPALSAFPLWEECVARSEVVVGAALDGPPSTVFPVRGEREVVGILVVETPCVLAAREIDLVLGILEILRNHLALLDYGELDTLTGLLNRKTFEARFEKLRQRLMRVRSNDALSAHVDSCEPSWLGLIDIDHFKSINDSYGHLFGDEVLLLVSRLMKNSFRGSDQVFRFGGEEFVVVLEHASAPGAQIAFDRLRSTVAEHVFPQVGRVTISVGYTQIHPVDVPALCLERADAALYYAKSHGRNNVHNCEALRAAGEISVKSQVGEVELF